MKPLVSLLITLLLANFGMSQTAEDIIRQAEEKCAEENPHIWK